jgi:hypothetical protein
LAVSHFPDFGQVPLVVPYSNRYTGGDAPGGEVMPRRKPKEIVQVKIRLHSSVVSQLKAAAKKSGHSFNAEAAIRLGKSFGEEAMFGGEAGRRWMHYIATMFVFAGERYYRDYIRPKQATNKADERPNVALWINDPKVYQVAMMHVIEELMINQPEITYEKFKAQVLSLDGWGATHFINKSIREKKQ